VFVTSHDVVRVGPGVTAVWGARFRNPELFPDGGLLELPGGDLVAFLYGRLRDSGVRLVRLDPAAGKEVWQTACAPLGAATLSSPRHRVVVAAEGDRVRVTSHGSHGRFTEVLDLRTGRSVSRTGDIWE
jgi:hypothetical protein